MRKLDKKQEKRGGREKDMSLQSTLLPRYKEEDSSSVNGKTNTQKQITDYRRYQHQTITLLLVPNMFSEIVLGSRGLFNPFARLSSLAPLGNDAEQRAQRTGKTNNAIVEADIAECRHWDGGVAEVGDELDLCSTAFSVSKGRKKRG